MGNQTCCARDYSRKDAEIFKGLSPCASLKDSLSLSQTSLMPKGIMSETTTITDLPSLNSATLSRPLRSKSDDDQDQPQKKFACTLPYMPSMSDDNEEVLNTEQLTFRPHKVASLKALNFQGLDTPNEFHKKLFHDNIDSSTRAKNLNEHILDVFTRQAERRGIDTVSTGTRASPNEVFTPLSGFAKTCTGFYDERQSHKQKRAGETRDTLYATLNSKNLRDTMLMDNNSPSGRGSLHGMTPKFIEDLSSFCEFDNV